MQTLFSYGKFVSCQYPAVLYSIISNARELRMQCHRDGRMGGWADGRIGGWADGRMGGWADGLMRG